MKGRCLAQTHPLSLTISLPLSYLERLVGFGAEKDEDQEPGEEGHGRPARGLHLVLVVELGEDIHAFQDLGLYEKEEARVIGRRRAGCRGGERWAKRRECLHALLLPRHADRENKKKGMG